MADVSLSNLADHLNISSVSWSVKRNDQISGTGDGRIVVAELAPPLWTADVSLAAATHNDAKQVAARIRALRGSLTAFMLYDPISKYPQMDPDGSILGSATATISAIGAGRSTIAFSGLPASYKLTVGDKMQITDSADAAVTGFFEFSSSATANGFGSIASISVFPNLPAWVSLTDIVTLKLPACRVIIVPGSHDPGKSDPSGTTGQTFQVIQKR